MTPSFPMARVCGIICGRELTTVEDVLRELELSLVTVQDVIDRNADGAPPEDSYIGVNLGLYIDRVNKLIRHCRTIDGNQASTKQ